MDEEDIRDFLVANPDYFLENKELLGLINIPHSSGAAVSLVERQVSVLRERNVDLRHKLRDLGASARENEQLFGDVRSLVLGLVPEVSLSGLRASLLRVFREQFDLEYASLTLFEEQFSGSDSVQLRPESQIKGRMSALLGTRGAGCGPLRAEEFDFLFPGAKLVGSAAVALIEVNGKGLGLLAVGSSDAGHYESSMGTLFLEFAAEVLGLLLIRTQNAPEAG
ncbi:MAG: DUF484 family protein [Pseudomonadota bacterium]